MAAPQPPSPADLLEEQLIALESLQASLASRVADAQAETLEHLTLFEAGVAQLEASASDAAARRAELLAAARRLATELRGLDLLAGHVQSVEDLVKRLEAATAEVLASGGVAAAAAAGGGGGGGKG